MIIRMDGWMDVFTLLMEDAKRKEQQILNFHETLKTPSSNDEKKATENK